MKPSANDVVLVSVFGRGNWLASRLAEQGMKVTLVDVSEQMGHWVPEDWEGPFGFFRSERLEQSQLQRLIEDEPEESVDRGFTIWLKNGPLELKGPLGEFSLSVHGVDKDVQKYLLRYDAMTGEQRRQLKENIAQMPFTRSWLAHLAHQLSSNVMRFNAQGISFGEPLPVFAPYYFRRVSRRGLRRGIELCEKKGVRVLPAARVIDIGAGRGQIEGIEVVSDYSGFLFAKDFVWMLTSQETERFSTRVSGAFFPKGALESDWFWTRFRLAVEPRVPFPALPSKFAVIEDLNLPWAHDNLLCCEKTVKDGDLDVWARLPTRQRFHRAYVEGVVERILRLLNGRLSLPVTCAQMPQDYIYDQEEVGPPRFPIYDAVTLKNFRPARFGNCYFDGPEVWRGLDWHSQFRSQAAIAEQIVKKFTRRRESGSISEEAPLD